MEIGLNFGTTLYRYSSEDQVAIARKAETCGFSSLWAGDHLVLPAKMPLRDMAKMDQPLHLVDPQSPTARVPFPATEPVPDMFVTFAYLAASTTRLKFGSAIYLLALRHPMVSARSIGTLDLLSGGRLKVGVGVGWLKPEFELASVDYASRGRRTEEYILVIKKLWIEEEPQHHGEFVSFGPSRFEPKPATPGGPPILIGGETEKALRRAASIGDGWCGRTHTPTEIRSFRKRLRDLRLEYGREKDQFIVQSWLKPDASRDDARGLEDAGTDDALILLHDAVPSARDALDYIDRTSERLLAQR